MHPEISGRRKKKKMLLAVVLFKCVDCCMLACWERKFWSNVVTFYLILFRCYMDLELSKPGIANDFKAFYRVHG